MHLLDGNKVPLGARRRKSDYNARAGSRPTREFERATVQINQVLRYWEAQASPVMVAGEGARGLAERFHCNPEFFLCHSDARVGHRKFKAVLIISSA